jgi:hypothetical protein
MDENHKIDFSEEQLGILYIMCEKTEKEYTKLRSYFKGLRPDEMEKVKDDIDKLDFALQEIPKIKSKVSAKLLTTHFTKPKWDGQE